MARAAHHALISAVGDAHPTFCGSMRLLKRWLQRQLLGAHIGEEAAELLCAAAYTAPCVSPSPGNCPLDLQSVLNIPAVRWLQVHLLGVVCRR